MNTLQEELTTRILLGDSTPSEQALYQSITANAALYVSALKPLLHSGPGLELLREYPEILTRPARTDPDDECDEYPTNLLIASLTERDVDNVERVLPLLNEEILTKADREGTTALHAAAGAGRLPLLPEAFLSVSNLTLANKYGVTPFSLALHSASWIKIPNCRSPKLWGALSFSSLSQWDLAAAISDGRISKERVKAVGEQLLSGIQSGKQNKSCIRSVHEVWSDLRQNPDAALIVNEAIPWIGHAIPSGARGLYTLGNYATTQAKPTMQFQRTPPAWSDSSPDFPHPITKEQIVEQFTRPAGPDKNFHAELQARLQTAVVLGQESESPEFRTATLLLCDESTPAAVYSGLVRVGGEPGPLIQARMGATNDTVLHFAAGMGRLNNIPGLTRENLFITNRRGETPVHMAAGAGHLDQIPSKLLSADTPEHRSCRWTHADAYRRPRPAPGSDTI